MKRINPSRWLRTGIMLAVLPLVGLATLAGVGTAQTQVPPTNAALPTVLGMAKQGATVAASSGVWNAATPIVFAFQWQLCDAAGESCVDVGGARAATRTLPAEAVGRTVRVVVTATNAAGSRTAASKVSAVVVAIPDNVPRNTAPPTLRGDARLGQRLMVHNGAWKGASRIRFTYEWQRCDVTGGSCLPVARATSARYGLTVADVSKTIRVVVTASNTVGTNTAVSKQTIVVTGPNAPTNTREPRVSGSTVVGSTLTATQGAWSGAPTAFAYQWTSCPSSGGAADASNCATISGATTNKYVPGKADVGKTLRVRVTAKNATGSKTAASNATAIVRAAAQPVSNGCAKTGGTVPIAGVSPPARLTIDQTQVSPSTLTFGTRSVTARFHVSACGGSVQGALVYTTAVPYAQFAIPNEQATGSDGWATLQFTALSGYPVSNKQQLLVMFVRARKNGENLLGGISTRRLVSFRVTRG
jgi:hypothetical protein